MEPKALCAVCGEIALARCKRCTSVGYCGRACQRKDWPRHKTECQALAAKRGRSAGRSGAVQPRQPTCQLPAPAPSGSNALPPVPRHVLHPYDEFLAGWESAPTRNAPVGMRNAGNSCFANGLLQALLSTRPLAAYLLSGAHSSACGSSSGRQWCLLCELERLAQGAYAHPSADGVLDPRGLLSNIKRLGKQFTEGQQEDAHELYVQILDGMERALLAQANAAAASPQFMAGMDQRSRETTAVHHAFLSYLRTEVVCRRCGTTSATYAAETALGLDVPDRPTSLAALLQALVVKEELAGECAYKCAACHALVPAWRSTRVEVAPNALVLCLKRFAFGRGSRKVTTPVTFPERLDMQPYLARGALDQRPAAYRLYCVVVHQTLNLSTNSGHYVAYVRCGDGWFLCDDDSVEAVPLAQVLAASAYLLFYERRKPREVRLAQSQFWPAAAVPASPTPGAAAAVAAGGAACEAALQRATEQRLAHASNVIAAGNFSESSDDESRASGEALLRRDVVGATSAGRCSEAEEEPVVFAGADVCRPEGREGAQPQPDRQDSGSSGSAVEPSTDARPTMQQAQGKRRIGVDVEPPTAPATGGAPHAAEALGRPSSSGRAAARFRSYSVEMARDDGRKVLRIAVDLPVLAAVEDINVALADEASQWLRLSAGGCALQLPLPLPVDPLSFRWEWEAQTQRFMAHVDVAADS